MTLIKSINPYSNEILKEFKEYEINDLESILSKAEKTFSHWKKTGFNERSEKMKACSNNLLKNKNEYAKLITNEMGKPILQSIAEVEKCASACLYFAENAESFLKNEFIQSDASQSFVSYEPLGCVLAVMPWNFPFWQVFRFAAPALMAGNVGILKHASNVPQCSLTIERIFLEAGFPEGVFQSVLIGSSKVSYLIDHPVVKAVTLTGSEKAGSEVAAIAGKNIKKTVLELGGSDCFIVLKDADLKEAAEVAVRSRLINNGQSCIAAKRFIIESSVYEAFLEEAVKRMDQLKIGDPLNKETDLGPLARKDLAVSLNDQVEESLKKGARKVYEWARIELDFPFFRPAILSDIKPGTPAYEEELFGPVACFFSVKDEREAIRIANDSRYGLGGSIWTGDPGKGRKLAGEIEAGSVFVNGMVKSDPRLPFGGIKYSGYGRELSYPGIREFVNIKTMWVR
jgi:succinate-semialdehyde dehydrogenase/glutarate-semialdehyde dehydrogenase